MIGEITTAALLVDLLLKTERLHNDWHQLARQMPERTHVDPTDSMDSLTDDVSAPPPHERPQQVAAQR